MYATPAELAEHLAPDPLPAGAARLLARAGRDVDEALLCARYAVDEAGLATDPKVAAAIKAATLEQAAYRIEAGEESGITTGLSSATIGSVTVQRAATGAPGAGTVGALGEQAHRALMLAGLTGHAPRSDPFEDEDEVW